MSKGYSILVYIVEFKFTTVRIKEAQHFTWIFEFASVFYTLNICVCFHWLKRLESVLCGRAAFTEDVAKVN